MRTHSNPGMPDAFAIDSSAAGSMLAMASVMLLICSGSYVTRTTRSLTSRATD